MRKVLFKSKTNGWRMEESIKLSDGLVLDISTSKFNVNGRSVLKTTGMVSHIKDGFKSTTLFKDFYKTYQSNTVKRVTENVVRDFHNQFNTDIAVIEAKQFYGV